MTAIQIQLVRLLGPFNSLDSRPLAIFDVIANDSSTLPAEEAVKQILGKLLERKPNHVDEWLVLFKDIDVAKQPEGIAETIALGSLTLQRWIGYPVTRYHIVQRKNDQSCRLAVEFAQRSSFIAAINAVYRYLSLALAGNPNAGLDAIDTFIKSHVARPSGQIKFIREAMLRGIPWQTLGDTENFLDLGEGAHKQRLWKHFTGVTPHTATVLSTDKWTTNKVLARSGLPVPAQRIVRTAVEAESAFQDLGPPVVIKPLSQDYGKGVFPGISAVEDVRTAFTSASKFGAVILEKHIAGHHHRIMVFNGKMLSARKQVAAHVVGDGVSNVGELVTMVNKQRLSYGWEPIPLDSEAQSLLARQKLTQQSVAEEGTVIYLRLQGNLSTGGTMDVVTDQIHDDNKRMAIRAATILGIDLAGIDFITTDITRSYLDVGGGICEVNVTPGFIFQEERVLLDHWFDDGLGRIPVIAIQEELADTHFACLHRLLDDRRAGSIAIVNRTGVSVDDHQIFRANQVSRHGIELALNEPGLAGMLCTLNEQLLTNEGSGLNHIDVLVYAGVTGQESAYEQPARHAEHVVRLVEHESTTSGMDTDHVTLVASTDLCPCPVCGESTEGHGALIQAVSDSPGLP